MKLHVLSDLHLEFGPLELPGGETLLLAGDICVADPLRPERTDKNALKYKQRFEEFFKVQCKKYDRVFYIAGNHEHYHGVFNDTHQILKDFVGKDVTVLENECVELDDKHVLYGATMWTDFNNDDWFAKEAARRGMEDFHGVEFDGGFPKKRTLHPDDLVTVNRRCFETLKVMVRDVFPDKKFVVMTHHAPTPMSSHPKFGGTTNLLNYAYHNNFIEWLVDQPRVVNWFHGHMHDNHDYMVGNCRVVCNPRGYVGYAPNEKFNLNIEFNLGQ